MSASFTTLAGQPFEESGSALGKGYGLVNLNTRFHGTDTYSLQLKGARQPGSRPGKPEPRGQGDRHRGLAHQLRREQLLRVRHKVQRSAGEIRRALQRLGSRSGAGGHPVSAATRRGIESRERRANVEEGNTLSLSVSRSDGSHGEASVSYRIVYGSGDTNDVAPLTGTLHWAAGQSEPQTISIPVKSDTLHEGDETFTPGAV